AHHSRAPALCGTATTRRGEADAGVDPGRGTRARKATPEEGEAGNQRLRARVLAAFFAAADRPALPLVRTAFLAAAERLVAVRRRAADRAWLESARREAALCPSRFSAPLIARERRAEGFFLGALWPAV